MTTRTSFQRKPLLRFSFESSWFMPDKVIYWKNQKLPFYKNKGTNTLLLAQANLETSAHLLRWELMNPVLKTSNSLSIIHWGVYLKGLAESCRIIIRKTYLCCFPTIIFRNTTNLNTFVCQTWDWAESQVKKSWSAPAGNRKHQKKPSSTEELQHSLCQAENNPKYCVPAARLV